MLIILATVSIVLDAGTLSTGPSALLARRKKTNPTLSISNKLTVIIPTKVAVKLVATINNQAVISAASKKRILLKLGVKTKSKNGVVKRPTPRRLNSVTRIGSFYAECIAEKTTTLEEMQLLLIRTLPPTPMQSHLLNLLLLSRPS